MDRLFRSRYYNARCQVRKPDGNDYALRSAAKHRIVSYAIHVIVFFRRIFEYFVKIPLDF